MEDLTQDLAYRWLDSHKTLRKQFPPTANSVHLYLKVRFFAVDPSVQLNNEYTKYLCVLQIKKELLSGKMWCSRTTAALLASYIVQSKRDDRGVWLLSVFDTQVNSVTTMSMSIELAISLISVLFLFKTRSSTGKSNSIIKNIGKSSETNSWDHLPVFPSGQSPADTEMNYLRIASSLEMYGVELHKVSAKVIDHRPHVSLFLSDDVLRLPMGISPVRTRPLSSKWVWVRAACRSFETPLNWIPSLGERINRSMSKLISNAVDFVGIELQSYPSNVEHSTFNWSKIT